MESEAKTLVADVSYFEPLELHLREKPYISNVPFAETEGAWDNLNQVKHSQEMVNIRGHEDEFSFPQHGFQYVQHSFSHSPTDHIHSLEHPYVKEVEEFLLARFGASAIFVYDASIRKVGIDGYFQQADAAHIDHTEENCLWRLELAMKHLGLLGVQPRRFQIITAWRPLMKQVTSWPLADA
uniref:Uncharacterized protein n=1 Tax=Bionectria ochroleuca TaxID=29856 RepID=A0A8H7N0K1_BIOOC